jgi:hypothetical protein
MGSHEVFGPYSWVTARFTLGLVHRPLGGLREDQALHFGCSVRSNEPCVRREAPQPLLRATPP